jgi:integral membrane sensor domain MASE1
MLDDPPKTRSAGWWPEQSIRVVLGVAALYFLLALGSLQFLATAGLGTLLWPAAGLAVAATLLFGRRVLPGVFLGSMAANVVSLMSADISGTSLWSTPLAIGVGAVIQTAVAATLVERVQQHSHDWTRARRVMTTMLVMGPLACTITATIATATQILCNYPKPRSTTR